MTGSDKRPPLRVVVVGAGYFAQFHCQAWAEAPDVAFVGLVDRDRAKAAATAARWGGPTVFTDLAAALDALQPDLVDIAAPPEAHLDLIDMASAAGAAVICQKPFCGGLAGARAAVALAAERGTPLIVHENFRFQPWWRAIGREIAGGRIGQLYDVTFRLRPGDGQGPAAYLSRQPYFQTMPRFLVHETAVHLIDVFRFLMGEPDWVMADLRRLNPAIRGEDAGTIILGFADGRRALFDGNRLSAHVAENRRLVMGEAWADGAKGALTLNGDGAVAFRAHDGNALEPVPAPFQADRFGGGCVGLLQAHVVQALSSGAPVENAAASYLRNLEIVEAVYRANDMGARIDLADRP